MISFLDHMRQSKFLPFAHRGASKIAPENTFAAFHKAYDLGFKIIETDVQSSRDGILYSFHDSCLKRLTGDRRRFGMLSSQEIDKFEELCKIAEENMLTRDYNLNVIYDKIETGMKIIGATVVEDKL